MNNIGIKNLGGQMKIISTAALMASIVVGVSACKTTATRVSQAELDAIAVCNAGINISSRVNISAKIAEALKDGAELSASAEKEVKGLLLNSDVITAENVDSMYEKQVQCVKDNLRR